MEANKLLNDHCHWKVGDGRTINVTNKNWLGGYGPLFKDNTTLNQVNIRVADLLLPNQQRWDQRKITSLFVPATARHIKSIELPSDPQAQDFVYWPYTKSGEYSVKSGYDFLLHQQHDICSMTSPFDSKFFRIIWRLNIMPKWRLFLWKLWHNGLATTSNLHKRGISLSSECPICLDDQESTHHLFRFCPLALEAWRSSQLISDNSNTESMSFRDWLRYWILHYHNQATAIDSPIYTFIGTLWTIWLSRNSQVFRQHRPSERSIGITHQQTMQQHLCYVQQQHDPTRNLLDPCAPPGFQGVHFGKQPTTFFSLTLYVAGTKFQGNHRCGIAWLGRTGDNGAIMQQGVYCYAASTIQTEALACLRALSWARAMGHRHIKICTSSLLALVQALRTHGTSDITIRWTVESIATMANSLLSCFVLHVPPSQVNEARRLASWCQQHFYTF